MNLLYPYSIDEIDFNNIIFTQINNNKLILIKYNDNYKIKNFVFQIPTLVNNHININNKFEINLECYNSNKINKLLNFFNNLDNKIISESKNNINWFNHLVDKTNIKYQRIINDTENCTNGCINFNLINNKDFKTKILLNDYEYNKILPENGSCKIILECYGLYISDLEFKLILRPIILSFKLFYNYQILNDSDNDTDNDDNNNSLFIKSSYN